MSATQVKVTVALGQGPTSTQSIRVTNPDGQSASVNFQAIGALPPPVISSISPPSANKGTTPTFTLTGTGFQSGFTAKLINELGQEFNANSVQFVSATQVKVTVALGQGPTSTQSIRVTNPDGQSASVNFQAIGAPVTPVLF